MHPSSRQRTSTSARRVRTMGAMRTAGRIGPQPKTSATQRHTEPEELGAQGIKLPQLEGLRRASPSPHVTWLTSVGREESEINVLVVHQGILMNALQDQLWGDRAEVQRGTLA